MDNTLSQQNVQHGTDENILQWTQNYKIITLA
jgi:hypothetical protein